MRRTALRKAVSLLAVAVLALPIGAVGAANASGRAGWLADRMSEKVTGDAVARHLRALTTLTAANGGHRDSASPGYTAAADYLTTSLQRAGYVVQRQEFSFRDYTIHSERADVVSPQARVLHPQIARFTVSTPAEGLTAEVAVPGVKDTGCDPEDYAGQDVRGKIVLVRVEGGCFITQKQLTAAAVGASAMLMNVNSPNPDLNLRYRMVPPEDARVPVATLPRGEAEQLMADVAAGPTSVRIDLRGEESTTRTFNLLADTPTGRADNTVVMGAHLDSVDTTPGANDNAAASAAVLETALRLKQYTPLLRNKVRFAWWAAEEKGLSGSQFYVDSLTAEQRAHTALYLNLEMIGSPNFARQVYSGQTPTGPAPAGSERISQLVKGYFAGEELPTADLVLDGRSDHTAFVNGGIASGGVNGGSDRLKPAEWVDLFGGVEGQMLDPCYHQLCDGYGNVNQTIFEQFSRSMAWAVGRFAIDTSDVNGVR
ncbi:M28 family peptidase [Umezawaea sp. Da 62-37]|uniref:M28 family peptidase n=1 Tax=Umezawaea sp. Da 62-37 TaxID=3075927 RepID=UPI0028F6C5E1|nr:M28 family peptidase [Umezawaea sp. Da 62-37]WNV84709.1 M28 family peptidase [Umezawaea sp. Da 62-37]